MEVIKDMLVSYECGIHTSFVASTFLMEGQTSM